MYTAGEVSPLFPVGLFLLVSKGVALPIFSLTPYPI